MNAARPTPTETTSPKTMKDMISRVEAMTRQVREMNESREREVGRTQQYRDELLRRRVVELQRGPNEEDGLAQGS